MARIWKIIDGKQVLWDEETNSIVPQTLGWDAAKNFIKRTDKVFAKADKAIASQKKEIMDSSLKYAGNQLGNLKSAIGDRLVWGDTPGVTLATQNKLDAQSKAFTGQQKDAQKFFGTGEFASKDDIKNRYLNNTGELKEIQTTVNTDNSGNTGFASDAVNSLLSEKPDPNSPFALKNNPWGIVDSSKPANQLSNKQSPKLSKEEWLAEQGTAWEQKTAYSPAAQKGKWDKGDRWEIQKKANEERWDKKYESYIKKDDTPAIKQKEIDAQDQTLDTTSTNIGAKDIASKLGGDFGKAYKMIQTGKELWAMAKGAKAATAASTAGAGAAGAGAAGAGGGAAMAALGPLGIAAAVGLAMLAKKGEKEGKPNLKGGRVVDEDETMFFG